MSSFTLFEPMVFKLWNVFHFHVLHEKESCLTYECLLIFICFINFRQRIPKLQEAVHAFFYKEPTSRPSSKSSLFVDLKSANCSTNSSLIVP